MNHNLEPRRDDNGKPRHLLESDVRAQVVAYRWYAEEARGWAAVADHHERFDDQLRRDDALRRMMQAASMAGRARRAARLACVALHRS